MIKKEKFDVAVAAFEALLSKNKLWEEYLIYFNRYELNEQSEEIYTDWKKWAANLPVYQWFSCAFFWEQTSQGRDTWKDLDYLWLIWICETLNTNDYD